MSNYDPQLALRQTIAGVLDHPSVYMGGPSQQNLRKADRIIERLRSDSRLMEALRAGKETPAELCCAVNPDKQGVHCQLPLGHESSHRHETEMAIFRWPATNR